MTDLAMAMTSLAGAIEQLTTVLRSLPIASNEAAKSDTPPAPWTKPGHWCTPERKEILRELYPSPATPAAIKAKLEAIDGPPIPHWDNIGTYCLNVLRIRRPAKPAPDAKPIVVDAYSLRMRAALWGFNDEHLSTHEILELVNEKAARIGHPPFELEARKNR